MDEAHITEQRKREREIITEASTRVMKGYDGWKRNTPLTMVENEANPGIQRKAKHPNGITLRHWGALGLAGCCKEQGIS